MNPYVELAVFRTRAGVTADQVLGAAEEVNEFLKQQDGFLSRTLGRSEDGIWYDILRWESMEHVMLAMAMAAESPQCTVFYGLIDETADSMTFFSSLLTIEK